jgi:all-trans-retinol dehydrogenase (NAD+)
MSTLKGKRVLITGGASGIGKIMGRLALEHGAELIIWDINTSMAEETAAELSKLGKVNFFKVDVSSPEEIKSVAASVKEKIGVVDVLINNAGIVVGKYFHEHTVLDIKRTMDINSIAPMMVTGEFLPGMIKQNSGHVCNIASSAGLISNPRMSVYAASKWAVIGWSDSVRLEMKMLKKNINVTTVTPYYINTGMFDGVKSLIPILKPERAARKVIRGIERNRIFVSMPWSVHFVRFFQGLLPVCLFDWFVGGVMGIYKTMDHFQGRKS